MKKLFFTLFILLINGPLFSAFRDINWSPRASGMGGAFVGIADDANSILINPAGIKQVEHTEAGFMYTKIFTGVENVDLSLGYTAFVHNLGKKGAIGLAWAVFDTKELYRENTLALAYSFNLADYVDLYEDQDLYLGLNLKYLEHGYTLDKYSRDDPVFSGGTSKGAISLDLGCLVYPIYYKVPELSAGLSLKNINQPDVGLDSKDIVPAEISAGLAYGIGERTLLNTIHFTSALYALDFQYRFQEWGDDIENKFTASLGSEFWMFNDILGLRAGVNSREASAGIGFEYKTKDILSIRFDYCFNFPFYFTENSGTHRGSLVVGF